MNKRILNKNRNHFLKQLFAENILSDAQRGKERRKTRLLIGAKRAPEPMISKHVSSGGRGAAAEAISQLSNQRNTSKQSRLDKVQQAELHIIDKYLSKMQTQENQVFANHAAEHSRAVFAATQYAEGRANSISNSKPLLQDYICIPPFDNRQNGRTMKDTRLSVEKISMLPDKTRISLLFSTDQIRNVIASKRVERQNHSELRNQLLESKKIRFLYGDLSGRQLLKGVRRAKQLPGSVSDNLFLVLESRLDVVLERCAFLPSVQSARQHILHKGVQVNSKTVKMPGHQLNSGDIVQVKLQRNCAFDKAERGPVTATASPPQANQRDLQSINDKIAKQYREELQTSKLRSPVPLVLLRSILQLKRALSNEVCIQKKAVSVTTDLSREMRKEHSPAVFKYIQDSVGKSIAIGVLHPEFVHKNLEGEGLLIDEIVNQSEVQFQLEKANPICSLFAIEGGGLVFASRGYESKLSEASAVCVQRQDDVLYNVYYYWLRVQRRILSNGCDSIVTPSVLHKRIKPLHLEVSYQSHSAIFLYPPQCVSLRALVDIDLLLKRYRNVT